MNNSDETKIKSLYYYFCKENTCNNKECVNCYKAKLHPALVSLVEHKNKSFEQLMRNHEQKLLDTVETIVALAVSTKQGYDFAISFFKNDMINKDL